MTVKTYLSRAWSIGPPPSPWMVRFRHAVVDGQLWPVGMEVRLAPRGGFWADSDDEDAGYWPPADHPYTEADIPAGGLPIRLLRDITLAQANRLVGAEAREEFFSPVTNPDRRDDAGEVMLAAIKSRTPKAKNVKRARGKQPMPEGQRLKKFLRIAELRVEGVPNKAIARRLKMQVPTIGDYLRWAEAQDPPLWRSIGRGRPGSLTPEGQRLLDAHLSEKGNQNG